MTGRSGFFIFPPNLREFRDIDDRNVNRYPLKQESVFADMNIIIGSDHAGFGLKEICRDFLGKRKEYIVTDAGVFSRESSDYPLIAHKVARAVASGQYDRGILICGSGIGMSIAANRHKDVRAALCCDPYSARVSRLHNDANILAMGERVLGAGLALEILSTFLATEFEGGRHKARIDQIDSSCGENL